MNIMVTLKKQIEILERVQLDAPVKEKIEIANTITNICSHMVTHTLGLSMLEKEGKAPHA